MSCFDEKYFRGYASFKTRKMKEAHYRGFLSFLNVPSQKGLALDIGCGYGYSCKILQELGYSVYGVDISPYALRQAKKIEKLNLLVCDCQKDLPFRVKFDLSVCFDVLEHLKRPETTIRHVFKVLKSKGIFVASTPNPLSKSFWNSAYSDPTHISLKSASEWKRILEDCGFSHVLVNTVHFIPITWRVTGKLSLIRVPETIGAFILMKGNKL
jgi:2-polyprenyl-3-methyl-5-hydroxy-6-metoxy-1,4-benzoquinol methylase